MPILGPYTLEVFSRSPEQTRRIGMRLGEYLRAGDLICLYGDLGSGKTTLVQGVAAGWGSLDPANSPTFILMNVYRGLEGGELFHLDAYRMRSAWEAVDLDLDSWLERGPLLVEWPERIQEVLPSERLWITLEWIAEEHRLLRLEPHGERYREITTALRRDLFGVT